MRQIILDLFLQTLHLKFLGGLKSYLKGDIFSFIQLSIELSLSCHGTYRFHSHCPNHSSCQFPNGCLHYDSESQFKCPFFRKVLSHPLIPTELQTPNPITFFHITLFFMAWISMFSYIYLIGCHLVAISPPDWTLKEVKILVNLFHYGI